MVYSDSRRSRRQISEGRKIRPSVKRNKNSDMKRLGKDMRCAQQEGGRAIGFAVNYYGFDRGTDDIDLLVDESKGSIKKIKEAATCLKIMQRLIVNSRT